MQQQSKTNRLLTDPRVFPQSSKAPVTAPLEKYVICKNNNYVQFIFKQILNDCFILHLFLFFYTKRVLWLLLLECFIHSFNYSSSTASSCHGSPINLIPCQPNPRLHVCGRKEETWVPGNKPGTDEGNARQRLCQCILLHFSPSGQHPQTIIHRLKNKTRHVFNFSGLISGLSLSILIIIINHLNLIDPIFGKCLC